MGTVPNLTEKRLVAFWAAIKTANCYVNEGQSFPILDQLSMLIQEKLCRHRPQPAGEKYVAHGQCYATEERYYAELEG